MTQETIKQIERVLESGDRGKGRDAFFTEQPERKIAQELARTHPHRKKQLEESKLRVAEIQGDVMQPKIDGMPHTQRPMPDHIGERLDDLVKYKKYIAANENYVNIVDASYALVGRTRKVTKAMIREYGGKPEVYHAARMGMRIHMENKCYYFGNIGFPWEEKTFRKERRDFLDRICKALYIGNIDDVVEQEKKK